MTKARLTEKHRQIALLAATGTLQHKEIAQRVGVHYHTVTRILKMPEVQALIAEIRQEIEEHAVRDLASFFDEAAGEAFHKLCELMREAPPSVALRAVQDVLDRSRNAPKRQIHARQDVAGRVMHVHIAGSRLREMRSAMLEGGVRYVPELPALSDDKEVVVAIDPQTGEILSSPSEKVEP